MKPEPTLPSHLLMSKRNLRALASTVCCGLTASAGSEEVKRRAGEVSQLLSCSRMGCQAQKTLTCCSALPVIGSQVAHPWLPDPESDLLLCAQC